MESSEPKNSMNEKSYILDNSRKPFEDGGSLGSEDSFDDMRRLVREDEPENSGKFTSLPLASFNFINSIIGSGVIGIPYALHQAGFGLGIALLVIVAILTDYSLILMVRSGHLCGEMSYQGLMRASFGRPGFYILTALQFIYPFIAMVSYNVVVGDTVTKVLIRVTGLDPDSFIVKREVVIFLATLLVVIPLCLYRNVAKLAKISFLSLVCVGFILLAIFIRMDSMSSIVPSHPDSWKFGNIAGIVPAVGIMAFAFMCHHNTFLIYGSIERATQEKWDVVTHWSLFTSFLIAAAFGIAGYATFTGYVQGDLMENYCWDDDLMNFSRIMFSGTILLTFPIECFVTREVIMTAIRGTDEVENHDAYIAGSDRKYLIITMAIISVAYLISMSTDCLGIVLELNGILAAVPLAYVLPALCYLKLEEGSLLSQKKLPALALLVAGVFAAVSGLLLLIFNNTSAASCVHGQIMSYCQSPNSTDVTSTTFKPSSTTASSILTSLLTSPASATTVTTTAATTAATSTLASTTTSTTTTTLPR
ncbi:putative sodium-coupled neutral amino acid transporter 11 isoform X1 [Nasonia vitripennis]|uniref:Putative sodium-coupled neutral amino acid transporter 11 n=1 Tax=Nasonia vitripennis TaxID=7425 RepID=A0A7M7HBR5_NASVI|nr:putative sodium-coupled neutral amino acid transporter 11 isoform X1 [Nasonia vitripennis]